MNPQIIPIQLGFSNSYIIQEDGTLLIDCGIENQADKLVSELDKNSIAPTDIDLIVITHAHMDHIGSVAKIKELTNAPIAVHSCERDCLENSRMLPAKGATLWGKILSTLMSLAPQKGISPISVDIELTDDPFSLQQYGISGNIYHTPGHTNGSVTVLLDTGDAFVGDLAMNAFPMKLRPGFPIFAEDMETVKSSWQLLIDNGATTIYPGHGDSFSIDVIEEKL